MKSLIKNKKAFTSQDFIVSFILFSGCLALFVLMVGSMADDYDNSDVVDPVFSSSFDKYNETKSLSSDMWDSLQGDKGLDLLGASELFFKAGFSVISLIFSSVLAFATMFITFPTYFGFDTIPSVIFMTTLSSILTVIIIFNVVNSLRGNKL